MGQRIGDIVIYADAPTVANLERVPRLAAIARALHHTTRTELIRRFLLLDRGDACDELRRAESERILRAQPYIADADVVAVENEVGGVDLEVHTSDEAAAVIGGAVKATSPHVTSLLLGNANVNGEGVFASIGWRAGDGFRDAVSVRVFDYQFLGRPWVVGVEGEQASLGSWWRLEGGHPYLTELQRSAWRVRTGAFDDYVELRSPDGARPSAALARRFFDVGGVVRVGMPGRLKLLGVSVTGLDERAGDRLVMIDSGMVRDVGALPATYDARRVVRVNALMGARNLRFVRIDGLDALTASQDVPIGAQVGALAGRGIAFGSARDDDVFVAGDVYVGATRGISTTRVQVQGEGRRDQATGMWDGILTTGRVSHALRLTPRQRNQVSLEWSGVWRQRTPVQLLLGVPEGGVRGYEESSFAGGQRLVLRTEERYARGNFLGSADAGVALFADVGRQWAGDVPFGVTTPVVASAGISVLAAVPPRSPRVWRVDLAFPVTPGANARWTLTFSSADRTAFVFRDPRDVARGREITAPSSIFAWP